MAGRLAVEECFKWAMQRKVRLCEYINIKTKLTSIV